MKLIIAEKPSLARNIVDAINGLGKGSMRKNAGFYDGGEYIVTWAFGHLFSLSDIEYYTEKEDYDPSKKASWRLDNLPCFPHKYNFSLRPDDSGRPDSGVEKQFETIKALCNRPDVDTIINAGDADREGEIIVRLCISKSEIGEGKQLKRLWLPDQTPETIRASLSKMKDSADYDLLAYEGYARTFIDWLYGTNLTRYATLRSGAFLRVGRVIVPIVKAIYDRDSAIKNFVPEPYYAIVSKEKTNGEEIELVSKHRFDKNELSRAEKRCEEYNALPAVVTSVKKKKTTLSPGKLYSLTKLQNVLSRRYKMPMNESLEIAQRLYERGFLTYPRTNSEYLATAEKDKMKQIIANVARVGYKVKFKDGKSIFDDSKIEAHSALTPTYKIPDKKSLSEKEALLYSTVMRRFVAVFCSEDCVVNKTEIVITLGDNVEEFTLKGTVILEKGWTAYDDSAQKDKILPDLKKGDLVEHLFAPVEKTTSPPKHYTVETLNNYLKNPFKEDKAAAQEKQSAGATDRVAESENDEEDYKAIFEGLELGTEATRTGIIENARQSEYIALNKDVYTILPKGEYLIETLSLLGISMDKYKTSMLGQALKKVYKGEISIRQSLRLAEREIASVFGVGANGERALTNDIGVFGDEIGVCPLCGRSVKRGRYGYGCTGYKEGCGLRIPLSLCKKLITVPIARALIEKGIAENVSGFISKKGTAFSANLKLEDGKVIFDFGRTPVPQNPPPASSASPQDKQTASPVSSQDTESTLYSSASRQDKQTASPVSSQDTESALYSSASRQDNQTASPAFVQDTESTLPSSAFRQDNQTASPAFVQDTESTLPSSASPQDKQTASPVSVQDTETVPSALASAPNTQSPTQSVENVPAKEQGAEASLEAQKGESVEKIQKPLPSENGQLSLFSADETDGK